MTCECAFFWRSLVEFLQTVSDRPRPPFSAPRSNGIDEKQQGDDDEDEKGGETTMNNDRADAARVELLLPSVSVYVDLSKR